MKHGITGYQKHRCRCDVCRAANAAHHREQRQRRRERISRGQGAPQKHGLNAYTNWGCRCAVCSAAHAERMVKIADMAHAEARRRNDLSRDTARNHRQQWTGAELEVVCRRDLPAPVVAEMLGRTVAAVNCMRQRVDREDPKTMAMLGELYR